ncbi:MAG: hypothetical protein WAM14_24485 [Candidatus Nitrosopolaris sp.]
MMRPNSSLIPVKLPLPRYGRRRKKKKKKKRRIYGIPPRSIATGRIAIEKKWKEEKEKDKDKDNEGGMPSASREEHRIDVYHTRKLSQNVAKKVWICHATYKRAKKIIAKGIEFLFKYFPGIYLSQQT